MTLQYKVGTLIAAATLVASTMVGSAQAREFRLGTIVPPAHAWNQAATAMGDALKEALKPQLTQIAGDVTKLLVEAQPDGQTVDVTGADNGNGCTHFLQIIWNFKGGTYRGNLTVTCGRPPSDWISRVSVANATVEPGEAGSVTAQALSQLGVPMPLATATSMAARSGRVRATFQEASEA